MRFKRFDLNLLVTLDALLKEQSVTRAAARLNISQPAMSAALGRLRQYLNDDVLVLHGKKMVPTAHAQSMAPMVARALSDIDALITASTVFDPLSSQRRFRICASDYVTVVLLSPLLATLEQSAPGIRFDISASGPDVLPKLERGEIDLLLTPEQFTAPGHPKQLLFEETHVVVSCGNNPLLDEPLTEEIFFAQSQVTIELDRAQTFAEQALGELNRRRHIDVVCSSFLAVPWLLQNTQRLAIMHERLARMMSKSLPLKLAPLPFKLPLMREMAQYNAARDSDGGIQWLLNCLLTQAGTMDNE